MSKKPNKSADRHDEEDNLKEDSLEEELQAEEEDEAINDEINEDEEEKEPLFPFDKMPYQEKGENIDSLHEYEMGDSQELNLGESEKRKKKRSLRDERGAGHEP